MKTRTYLLLMLVAIIVPVACVAILGLSMLLRFERESRLRGMEAVARSTALMIDSEVARAEAALRVVAHSEQLKADDFAGVHRLLSATRASPLTWTMVADYGGNGLLNTLVPYGTPLARNTGPWAAKAYDSQQASVGGYFIGALSRRGVVSINVPVPASAERRYVVTQIFDPAYFNTVLRRAALQPAWIVGVFDAKGISVARNKNAERFVGKHVRPELWEASRRQANGMVRHQTREGIEVYDTFVRSPLTNWTVAVGVPVTEIESAVRMTTWYAGMALVAILGVAVAIAVAFARRIDRALADAAKAAHALGKGTVVDVARRGLREVDVLLDALHRTSLALAQESTARRTLETEREELLAMERTARQRAEAQDRAKDDFISMLSHELRNPLGAITTAVTVLRVPSAPPAHKERAWDVVRRQLAHFAHMVEELLDVRRVLSGKVTLLREPINLADLVAACCEARRIADTKEHDWEMVLADAPVRGDRTRLAQVVDNLLVNAIKYTSAGGRIVVGTRVEAGMAVVEVADTGVGIAADVLPTIFESLVQGPTTIDRSQGGLGLGLSITRGLVHMHGGTIEADSDGLGMGSRFIVRLPLDDGPAPSA